MTIQKITLECPACGAGLEVGADREFCICPYCDTKIKLHNENEHIYRNIDEAGMVQAQTDRMIRLRELELEAQEKKADNIKIIALAVVTALLIIIGIIGFAVDNAGMGFCLMFGMIVPMYGYIHFDEKRKAYIGRSNVRSGKIKLSNGDSLKGKDVQYAQQMLRAAGFERIQLIPMNDLTNSLFIKPGRVKNVIIDGKEEFGTEEWFPKTAMVTVVYHSLRV